MSEELSLWSAASILLSYFAAFIVFGLFYSKHEEKPRALSLILAIVAYLLAMLLSVIPYFLAILAGAATYYVADRKNRNRVVWIILILVGVQSNTLIGPALFVLLLFLPRAKRPVGAPVSLSLNRKVEK